MDPGLVPDAEDYAIAKIRGAVPNEHKTRQRLRVRCSTRALHRLITRSIRTLHTFKGSLPEGIWPAFPCADGLYITGVGSAGGEFSASQLAEDLYTSIHIVRPLSRLRIDLGRSMDVAIAAVLANWARDKLCSLSVKELCVADENDRIEYALSTPAADLILQQFQSLEVLRLGVGVTPGGECRWTPAFPSRLVSLELVERTRSFYWDADDAGEDRQRLQLQLDLAAVAALQHLQELRLKDLHVAGLACLGSLSQLTNLYLYVKDERGEELDGDALIKCVAGLKRLRQLELPSFACLPQHWQHLCSMEALESLQVGELQLSDPLVQQGLQAGFTKLRVWGPVVPAQPAEPQAAGAGAGQQQAVQQAVQQGLPSFVELMPSLGSLYAWGRWGANDSAEMLRALRGHQELHTLELRDSSELRTYPAGALASLKKLQRLDLPKLRALSTEDFAALASDIGACRHLQQLKGDGLTLDSRDALYRALDGHSELSRLELGTSEEKPAEDGDSPRATQPARPAVQLPALPALQHLDLNASEAELPSVLAQVATRYPHLRGLHLNVGQDWGKEEGGQTDGIAAGLQVLAAGPAAASLETVSIDPLDLIAFSEVQQLFTAAFKRLHTLSLHGVDVADGGAPPATSGAAVEAVRRVLEAAGLQVESCSESRRRGLSMTGRALVDVTVARPGAVCLDVGFFVDLAGLS